MEDIEIVDDVKEEEIVLMLEVYDITEGIYDDDDNDSLGGATILLEEDGPEGDTYDDKEIESLKKVE